MARSVLSIGWTLTFDGSGSTDPEGRPLTHSWDLNGDGTFGDATTPTASYTYTSGGTYTASLRVTDDQGAANTASVTIPVGNTAPVAVIDSARAALRAEGRVSGGAPARTRQLPSVGPELSRCPPPARNPNVSFAWRPADAPARPGRRRVLVFPAPSLGSECQA